MLKIIKKAYFLILLSYVPVFADLESLVKTEAALQAQFGSEQAAASPDAMTRMLAQFYKNRNYKPLWVVESGFSSAATNALETFANADVEGLESKDYSGAQKAVARVGADPTKILDAEVALTKTALQYIDDIRGDRLHPSKIKKELYIQKQQADASTILANNMAADPTGNWLKSYTYQNPQYQRLKALLAECREALKADPANAELSKKIQKIVLNMERWRWLPEKMANRYVMVNIAAFNLKGVQNDKIVLETPVIVGHVTRKTPVFAANINSIRFNPSWNVPRFIAVKDKLPKIKRNPSYLNRSGFVLYNSAGNVISPRSVNWASVNANNFNYHLRQVPGDRNALGKIRFTLDNTSGIYLHDTPEKKLFDEPVREFSSGCIRVKDPIKLASFVFNNPQAWTPQKIKDNMRGNFTKNVALVQPVPVYITYFTVWQDDKGDIYFSKDSYGKDRELEEALKNRPHKLPS
jgi:murein L,D-transpeptidase YcbB/YkuD